MASLIGKFSLTGLLQKVVVDQLNSYVKPYVENLNTDEVTYSVYNGRVELKNLRLKKTVLERFGLPVDVVAGDIGRLTIDLPWQALGSQPARVNITDVYLLARARPQGKVDPEEDDKREQAAKQDRLRSAEAVDQAATQLDLDTNNAKPGRAAAIISKVIDNLQIHVSNIHVRYEDGLSTPDHPLAAGFTLDEFRAVSTDSNWMEAFISSSAEGVHKLAKLQGLAVYFDTDTPSISKADDDREGTINALREMLANAASSSNPHQYILKPVTGEARIIMNKQMSDEMPKIDAQVLFDEIGVILDRDQYRDALSLVDVLHFYTRTHQYHRYRPSDEVFEANPARARLKFAVDAISSEVHERHRRWTWEYLAKRRDTRKRYVELYVHRLAAPDQPPAPEDAEELSTLEADLTYEDIRFFRSVARAQAKKDAATRLRLEEEKRKAQPQTSGWSGWFWGGGKSASEGEGPTEADQKEIDDIIEYDASDALTVGSVPSNFMKLRVSAKLNKGSFSLQEEPHGRKADIIALVFDSFSADAVQLVDSVSGKIALGGFRVYDGTRENTLYPQIVRVKEDRKSPSRQTSLAIGGVDGAVEDLQDDLQETDEQAIAEKDPFFVMEVEHNPLDGRADNAVTIKMRHLEIIYHKGYVEAVVQFFKPPESQLESIGALLDAAGQTLDGIRKETRAGLEFALEQHKTLDIHLDMNAPIIIIPMDVSEKNCRHLVLDAGHIAVVSALANKDELREIQSKRGRQYNEDDFKQLEDLMYDRFSLRLEDTQLLMGDDLDHILHALDDPSIAKQTHEHIVERINMSFDVQNAILNAPNLTRFKVSGHLPELQLNFSDRKYKSLMKFIDVAIPKFGNDTPQKEQADKRPALPSSSNAFRSRGKIEEYNLADEDHHDEADKGDESMEDPAEQFYEAPDSTTDTQRLDLKQKTFQFDFSVGKLEAALFKSTSETTEKPLATAGLEGFGLTFELRKWDMSVDVFLRSLTLAMSEGSTGGQPLLSASKSTTQSKDAKLVQVRYAKVQKDSPEFMTVHDGVDQSIDAELSAFTIAVAPEPILSLYDFIMTTFVPRDEEELAKPKDEPGKPTAPPADQPSPDKIRVRVKLTSVQLQLENNNMRFATLAISAADAAVFLRSGTLRVGARIGSLSLVDDTSVQVAEKSFKELLAIEGQELADFSYETFDPQDPETFPGYNSAVTLRTGSLRFTFMEQPVHDLYNFALKFARMKALYDAASQAAVQRASEVTRMHFDVAVKTPIIVLPRDGLTSSDKLVLRLGEIKAKNEYLADPGDVSTINASISGINVTSELVATDDKPAILQMVDDLQVNFAVKQFGDEEHRKNPKLADSSVKADMTDVKFSVTQRQYVLIMDLLKSLPAALSQQDETESALESIPPTPSSVSTNVTPSASIHEVAGEDMSPELSMTKTKSDGQVVQQWTTLDLSFLVQSVQLELYDGDAVHSADLASTSIARFAVVGTKVDFKSLSEGGMEAEVALKTLTFTNTRKGDSHFREIIPAAKHEGNQIMLHYSASGGTDKSALAIVTVDSPRIILSIDPLAALLDFAIAPFKNASADSAEGDVPLENDDHEKPKAPQTALAFRIEVANATIVVLASDTDPKTQAIQLSIREVIMSQQAILALKVDQLGMSFGRMDKPAERVRFLDDLNVALSLDAGRPGRASDQKTTIDLDLPSAVIFRASYSDILLITDVVNKAIAVASQSLQPTQQVQPTTVEDHASTSVTGRRTSVTTGGASLETPRAAPSARRRSSVSRRRPSSARTSVIVSKQELNARVGGFQFVLVGDQHEMPMVHIMSDEFNLRVSDWTGDMKVKTKISSSIRYFNLTNSHWEPLMDPWAFELTVARTTVSPEVRPLDVKFHATQRLELNMTSAFIELAITSLTIWSKHGERIKTERGSDSPFKVCNRTGYSLLVWSDLGNGSKPKDAADVKRLEDDADIPWRFEDRKQMRENISVLRHNAFGVQIEDSPWESLRSISVDREGEYPYNLKPRLHEVSHQITCDIKLVDNVKIVTFRSPFKVENDSQVTVELIVVDAHGKATGPARQIAPGESCPLPLLSAYDKRFRLRPLHGFGFDYVYSAPLHWQQLMSRPIRPISCKPQSAKGSPFYFQAQAIFNSKDPATRKYPRMTLKLRAPIEIENLLPFDIQYRVHDRHTSQSSSSYLVKGGSSPLHNVELSHLLLLSVTPHDTVFKQSEYAIINTDDPELPQERHFQLVDDQKQALVLRLHYFTYPNSGGAFKVQIYSPFVFLNKTGLPFDLAAKTWAGGQKAIAGRDLFELDYTRQEPTPFMFGFPNEDRRNRCILRVKNSKWSKPFSFEGVAAHMEVVMASPNNDIEHHVGLSFTEGLGKYKLSKVVTIAPRFILKNTCNMGLKVRQHTTQRVMDVPPSHRVSIHDLQRGAPGQLCIAFDDNDLKWSAPFNISDIGKSYVTLPRPGSRSGRQYLLQVETHISGSSIFIIVRRETESWPLRLRNDTDLTFSFQQTEEEPNAQRSDRPIRTLKPHETVDYTWDWPVANKKRIRLVTDEVALPRGIDMMAIGIQPPIKIGSKSRRSGAASTTISLDVRADGNSQMLVISPYNEDTNVYKPMRRQGTLQRSESMDSIATSGFETAAVSEKPTLKLAVSLEGIGISVITKRLDELVYFSLRGLELTYSDYPQYYDASIDCKWIQIDNQLFGGLFPIILYPTVVPRTGKELESHPTLQASVAVLKDQSHGVMFVKYASILLQSMTVELDEDFLFAVLDFAKFKDATWREPTPDVLIEHPKDIPEPDVQATKADVFFEAFALQPVSLELSFMRTDRVNVDEKVSTRNPLFFVLNALTMTLGNVNSAPVNLRALLIENVRLDIASLQERVMLHYQDQFMSQIYRVLGSADFLGNPVGLFNNISSGVSDIFYEPYQGIVMHGNKDIGLGIARGATSFAKKTVFGITDSMTKFTSSIGKGLSAATLDSEFQTKRRMTQRRNKPKHALYGVAAGASAFADSVTSAFEGVASKPMEGAEKGGAAGFAKGVGQGFVGLFTKPAVGVMDFLSASTEGIRNTTTVFDQNEIDRVRLPRHIAADGVLRPFSARESLGQSWLKDLDSGAYMHESYVVHLDIPGDDSVAILSSQRILFVQLRKLRVIWQVPFEELKSLSLEENGIGLTLRGGTPGPFLPISDNTGREWLFRNIGSVVEKYNRTHIQRETD